MAGQKIRIRLKAYDHEVIDTSARPRAARVAVPAKMTSSIFWELMRLDLPAGVDIEIKL